MDEHRDATSAVPARNALEEFAKRARDIRLRTDLDVAAVEALDAFAAAGVDALLLKGPALARLLYTAGEHRGYSDVDLLVAPGDLPAARRALANLGYTNASEPLGIDDVGGVVHAEAWVARGHSARDGIVIDLHWRMAGSEAPAHVAWDALRARRVFIDIDGRRTPVLDPVGLAMHVATHAAQHGTLHPQGLKDLALGLERWPERVWREAAALAQEIHAAARFAAGLRSVPAGAALARELELPATDQLQWSVIHAADRPRGTFHLQALAEARGLFARAEVLRRSLLPPRKWIVWQHPWARRGGVRLVAAYGLHLMRAPAWSARAWRFRRRARRAR